MIRTDQQETRVHIAWTRAVNYLHEYGARCDVCGGLVGGAGKGAKLRHELCRVRKSRKLPTPRRDVIPECYCSMCTAERMGRTVTT